MSDTQFARIESGDGMKLDARIFKPSSQQNGNLVVVLVHPYSVLGGCQGLMKGIGRGLANQGLTSVTFDTRGAGRSTGKASITGSAELAEGAAVAGSAVDRVEQIVGYVSLGYPFGFTASILFGGHNKAILKSSKPKLFVMGTKDGFTSVKQLENKLKSAAGRNDIHLLEGVSHFQMEGPDYDAQMIKLILEFIASL
ncbi:hypothetical protein Leryth_019357 [Lithospermum erythrorhizon]|nr:hypothetical protein Leryth_019357 [Lithospermum erythrorhizon]